MYNDFQFFSHIKLKKIQQQQNDGIQIFKREKNLHVQELQQNNS